MGPSQMSKHRSLLCLTGTTLCGSHGHFTQANTFLSVSPQGLQCRETQRTWITVAKSRKVIQVPNQARPGTLLLASCELHTASNYSGRENFVPGATIRQHVLVDS